MELRNRPLMSFLNRPSWPPVWSWIGGQRDQYVTGEVGVLREVRMHEAASRKVFLVIDHNARLYMGCLMFNDAAFARAVHELLESHRGESIADIGGLEVDHLL
ncbi:MAG TPA: hypothetical protein VGH16_21130 [Candidatus Binatia bacterium]|jgi:hypothetical protein